MKVHKSGEDPDTGKDCPAPKYVYKNPPSRSELWCTVRVYVIRAFGLQPSDFNGLVRLHIVIYLFYTLTSRSSSFFLFLQSFIASNL